MVSRGKRFYLLALQDQYGIKIVGGWIFMFFMCKIRDNLYSMVGKRQFNLPKVTLGLTHVVGTSLHQAEARVGGYLYRHDLLHILCLTNAICVNC